MMGLAFSEPTALTSCVGAIRVSILQAFSLHGGETIVANLIVVVICDQAVFGVY